MKRIRKFWWVGFAAGATVLVALFWAGPALAAAAAQPDSPEMAVYGETNESCDTEEMNNHMNDGHMNDGHDQDMDDSHYRDMGSEAWGMGERMTGSSWAGHGPSRMMVW